MSLKTSRGVRLGMLSAEPAKKVDAITNSFCPTWFGPMY